MAFSNICELNVNLNAKNHFRHFKKPIALFLTQTKISWKNSVTEISWKNSLRNLNFPGNELQHAFRLHGGVNTFVQNSAIFTKLLF